MSRYSDLFHMQIIQRVTSHRIMTFEKRLIYFEVVKLLQINEEA